MATDTLQKQQRQLAAPFLMLQVAGDAEKKFL
jgi:hypothetical protein